MNPRRIFHKNLGERELKTRKQLFSEEKLLLLGKNNMYGWKRIISLSKRNATG